MAGDRGRRSKGPRRGPEKGAPGRRMPPPEATHQEAKYLEKLKKAATPLVVHLLDGSEVRGHIEYFDRDMVKITRPEGPHFFVRKDDIRYILESD